MMSTTVEEIRAQLMRGKEGLGRPCSETARHAVMGLVEQRCREGVGI